MNECSCLVSPASSKGALVLAPCVYYHHPTSPRTVAALCVCNHHPTTHPGWSNSLCVPQLEWRGSQSVGVDWDSKDATGGSTYYCVLSTSGSWFNCVPDTFGSWYYCVLSTSDSWYYCVPDTSVPDITITQNIIFSSDIFGLNLLFSEGYRRYLALCLTSSVS